VAPGLGWQDLRTVGTCLELQAKGIRVAPNASATKLAALLDLADPDRSRSERGELAFGTVDSFLLWRLTNGATHATDATNAARTALLDIHTGDWDDDLLALFGAPRALLPEVRDCAGEFGLAAAEHFGVAAPIRGVAGDQQAALIGQACFAPGMVKSTYGTGCFLLLNTGGAAVASRHRLLTTIAYQWKGARTYALEGAIFSAGASVQWLRDGLGIIAQAAETGALAAAADAAQRVYLVPAFTGLGAPHWNSEARAALIGLTRGTTRREIARAALESVAFQTRDLIAAMRADLPGEGADSVIRVDGGMSASDWTMQCLADMLGARVDRPEVIETTALGAAFLAGWQAGLYPRPEEFAQSWRLERSFAPSMAPSERESRYQGWREAVARVTMSP